MVTTCFEIEVMDNAGNEEEFTLEFAKTDRAPYELELNPGPNLVSFPANPADGDINAVFGGEGNEDITTVLSFDNTSGLWMTAMKGADGMFMGDLTTINGMNGYWVVSDGIRGRKCRAGSTGSFERPPPHIAVQEGWNLIGVVDAQQRQPAPASPPATTSPTSTPKWSTDSTPWPEAGQASIAKTDTDRRSTEDSLVVETGKAYWVYANEAGIIIP